MDNNNTKVWNCHKLIFQPLPVCPKARNTSSFCGGGAECYTLSLRIKHFGLSISIMLCTIFRIRAGSLHENEYLYSYFPMNSGRHFKTFYLLWATVYPDQWSDPTCCSILSGYSHKISHYKISFQHLKSPNYSCLMKTQHSQRTKKKLAI